MHYFHVFPSFPSTTGPALPCQACFRHTECTCVDLHAFQTCSKLKEWSIHNSSRSIHWRHWSNILKWACHFSQSNFVLCSWMNHALHPIILKPQCRLEHGGSWQDFQSFQSFQSSLGLKVLTNTYLTSIMVRFYGRIAFCFSIVNVLSKLPIHSNPCGGIRLCRNSEKFVIV